MDNAGSFQAFFEGWLACQQQFLDELLAAKQSATSMTDTNILRGLIARVLAHYQEYYDEKSRMANRCVFLAFSPTWFTPLERTFLWIAGFKPLLVCRLATNCLDDLTEEQIQRIQELSRETNRREKLLEEEMAKLQEAVASPTVVELARRYGTRYIDGEVDEVGHQLESLNSALENILLDADRLRTRTAETMTRILSPLQNLSFFVAAAQLLFRIRTLGFQKEADRHRNSTNNDC